MRVSEVSKRGADIPRGRVMIAIEGNSSAVEAVCSALISAGYNSTQCADVGDNDGEIIEYFMIARADKADFLATYKQVKK